MAGLGPGSSSNEKHFKIKSLTRAAPPERFLSDLNALIYVYILAKVHGVVMETVFKCDIKKYIFLFYYFIDTLVTDQPTNQNHVSLRVTDGQLVATVTLLFVFSWRS